MLHFSSLEESHPCSISRSEKSESISYFDIGCPDVPRDVDWLDLAGNQKPSSPKPIELFPLQVDIKIVILVPLCTYSMSKR